MSDYVSYDYVAYIDAQNYTKSEMRAVLQRAQDMGFPLDAGSWVEQMTLAQLDMAMQGVYDA